ncbi:MAG: 4Fe-4S dicluster domain-containing protein [Desulfovibrionaceae bacterium]
MNTVEALKGKTLYIDYDKCIGCETCESVCKFLYDQPSIVMARTADGQVVPIYCLHCEKAHCMKVCSRGALMRDRDGAVILDPMLCRGCETRNCMLACPYAAFFESDKGVGSRKCDLCARRRAVGLEPACVEMCPCGAINYVDRDQVDSLTTEAARRARDRVLESFRASCY